jgi:hypothetical protein
LKKLQDDTLIGRKDRTLAFKETNNKRTRTEIVEEHVALLAEPGNKYLGHVVPVSGHSNEILKAIFSSLTRRKPT